MDREQDRSSAWRWALRALTRRMHTVHEIHAGLRKRGFHQDVIESVVAELLVLKYLDDQLFAQTWISSRSATRLHGRLRLARDLKQKGVPENIVEDAMGRSLTVEEELAHARKAAEKKVRTLRAGGKATGYKARAALYRHLSSRGFTGDVVRAALDEIVL